MTEVGLVDFNEVLETNCTRTTVQNPGNHTFYQFRIYDRALTDEEVAQNYNANINRFN